MKWCFHHIPKTAGSTLQLRLSHREWLGELDTGSTLVVSPIGTGFTKYRVCEDPLFDPQQPFKQALSRRKGSNTQGKSHIVMGHLTTVAQQGKHVTWVRHPLDRDLSQHRYDLHWYNHVEKDPQKYLGSLEGDFLFAWLWRYYMGRTGGARSKDHALEQVLDCLDNMERVFLHQDFEQSWDWICSQLNISREPRLNTNTSNTQPSVSQSFRTWHAKHNPYDYAIWDHVQKFKL